MAKQTSRYVPNPLLEQELAHSTMLLDDLSEKAQDIQEHIEATVPVNEGTLRDSFTVETGMDSDGVVAQIQTDDWKAVIIEFGTVEHDFNAPIRRGIEAAGYRMED